jgi:hypothetical protein
MAAVDPLRALGAYWLATGAWALVDLRSFMLLTGRKQDTWLVQTFGALVGLLGFGLLTVRGAEARRTAARLGSLAALAIAASEVVFVGRRRISPVYLVDAAVEMALVAAMMSASGPSATKRPGVTT